MRQNFQRPPSHSASIGYKLQAKSHVTLIVFDSLGRRIATLRDEVEGRGNKIVKFNPCGLTHDEYYYQLSVQPIYPSRRLRSYNRKQKLHFLSESNQERSRS